MDWLLFEGSTNNPPPIITPETAEKMKTPILDEFVKGWIGLFTRSPKIRLAWKTATHLPVPTYSTTRWWSKWEVIEQLMKSFGDVDVFLVNSELLPSKTKLLQKQSSRK